MGSSLVEPLRHGKLATEKPEGAPGLFLDGIDSIYVRKGDASGYHGCFLCGVGFVR